MSPPIPLDAAGVKLAMQAFMFHWPSFSRWFADASGRSGQALNGYQDADLLPAEPFEAALRAYIKATDVE